MTRPAIEEQADWVVVGSGAGGATVARTLALAGEEVVVVEEGPHLELADRGTEMAPVLSRFYRDAGMTVMHGKTYIPYLQGCCVGGTPVVNGAIMWRLPEDVLAGWLAAEPALGEVFSASELERCFEVIEREVSVRPVEPQVEGRNNAALRRGAEALGWAGRKIRRNELGCKGSGRCLQGCPHGAKQSMEQSYLPLAGRHGARLYAETRIEAIRTRRGRAVGVAGWQAGDESSEPAPFTAYARRGVVLAAGAVQTSALLRRNRLGGPQVGERFMCNPGVSMAARFEEPIDPWQGATQGYEVTELRHEGVKLEAIAMPPELAAMRLSGAGGDLVERLAMLSQCATAGAAIRAKAVGRIRPSGAHGASVRYRLTDGDVAVMSRGLWALAEVFRAAGASAVWPSVHGWPAELAAADAPEWIADQRVDERQLKIAVTHLFGGACAGGDPARSVVTPHLVVRGVGGLYAADASVFPGNTGVNPQQTIMAFAMAAAERWLIS